MSPAPKTAWASRIVIVDAKTGEELEVGNVSYGINEMTDAFTEVANQCGQLTFALKGIIRLYSCPKRFKTGVDPKIHNRTKKKQRLTRLQRRAKRQKR